MKLNKAFILATAGAYFGLAIATSGGYPTIVGVPYGVTLTIFILCMITLGYWGSISQTPDWSNVILGWFYGVICAVTFIGLENWGNQEINLAMALWDMICAVCFLLG